MQVDLKNKALTGEIYSVLAASPDTLRESRVEMVLHAGENDFRLQRVLHCDIKKNFNSAYTDHITVVFDMPLGDYIYHVLPYKDTLTATLDNYNIGVHTSIKYEAEITKMDEMILNGKYKSGIQEELNRHFTRVEVQLLSLTYKAARTKQVMGIYKEATVGDVITTLFAEVLNKHSNLLGFLPGDLNLIPPDNTRKYDHIVIPHGTGMLELPYFLQHGDYGVYNGDIGTYITASSQREEVYIYPVYRTNLLSHFDQHLKIISVDTLTLAAMDSTYTYTDNEIKILVTANPKPYDNEDKLKNKGVSITTVETDAIPSRPIQISKDKMKADTTNTTRRYTHKKLNSQAYPIRYEARTNNNYQARSEVLKDDGVLLTVEWRFSNASLIKPMMPVIFLEEAEGTVKHREGLVQQVYTVIDNNTHTEVTNLVLFLINENNTDTTRAPLKKIL